MPYAQPPFPGSAIKEFRWTKIREVGDSEPSEVPMHKPILGFCRADLSDGANHTVKTRDLPPTFRIFVHLEQALRKNR